MRPIRLLLAAVALALAAACSSSEPVAPTLDGPDALLMPSDTSVTKSTPVMGSGN